MSPYCGAERDPPSAEQVYPQAGCGAKRSPGSCHAQLAGDPGLSEYAAPPAWTFGKSRFACLGELNLAAPVDYGADESDVVGLVVL